MKTQLPFHRQVLSRDLHFLMGTLTLTTVTYMDLNGRRVTAENSYLTPEVLRRPNLKVITSATVTKVIFDKTGNRPRAVGVELATSRDGPRFKAKAGKEVILWLVLPLPQFSVDQLYFVSQRRSGSHTSRK